MTEKKYILAQDHGTSSNKATLCNLNGEIIAYSGVEYPVLYPKQGWAEQDPENHWYKAVCESTRKVMEKANAKINVKPENIAAITSSNQMWVTVPVDKDGKPLMNAISWLDSRGADDVKKAIGGFIEGYSPKSLLKWLRVVGAPPSLASKDNFGHILWITKNRPDIHEKTYKFLDAKDYLNFKFTGKMFTTVDTALLSIMCDTRDLNNVTWYEPFLKIAGTTIDKMPDIIKSTDIGGGLTKQAADDMGLIPDIPVIAGGGDGMCAAVGSGGTRKYMTHISIGTSSWVGCHYDKRKVDIAHYMGSVASAIPGLYLAISEQETAGNTLNFLRDNLLYNKDELLIDENVPEVFQIFDKLVEKVPAGSQNMIFTPWLFGEKSPFEDHNARGIMFNVSLDHTREHLVRAIFEGVAFNIYWCYIYLEKMVKKSMDDIRIIGGGGKSDIWCQIFADIFNRNMLQMSDPKEAAGRGAALIASVGLGNVTWEQIPDLVKVKKIYKPNPENRKTYEKLFKEFQLLYKNNKKAFKRLNSH